MRRPLPHRPDHAESRGDRAEAIPQSGDGAAIHQPNRVEGDAHEEPIRNRVIKLLRIADVARRLEQIGGYRRHNAGAVGAGQSERDEMSGHDGSKTPGKMTGCFYQGL